MLDILTEHGFTEAQLLHREDEEGFSSALDVALIDWGRVLAGEGLLSPVDWGGHFWRGPRGEVWWRIKGLEVSDVCGVLLQMLFRFWACIW